MLFEGGHKPAWGLGNEEGRQGKKMAAPGDGKRETFQAPSQYACYLHPWARPAFPCGLSRRIKFYPYKVPLQNDEILELERLRNI